MKRPTPVNAESTFDFNEMFFSTTDLRGVIRYGNDVFVRVSNYPREKLIAAPHSLIRHPDMPRAVFKVLWDTIQAGQPIAAYVKNLAANGHYYWVMAFVFPLSDGYLSIRVKPSSGLFQAVQGIYAQTLAVEKEKGMDESLGFLVQQILGAGFSVTKTLW
jgi:aerotaxis receptor